MTTMPLPALRTTLRDELRDRRDRLAAAAADHGDADDLRRLLGEVDSALDRLATDAYGRCDVCDGVVEEADLLDLPTTPYCLCDPGPERREALQHDLDLAWRVQAALLPKQDLVHGGWTVHFRYLPAGPVSGDYCDVITPDDDEGAAHFLLGDVSGKGIAASILMAHLNALARGLVRTDGPSGPPVARLVEAFDRRLTRSTPAERFVTLVCGRADAGGTIELSNAGHCPPVILRRTGVEAVPSTGFPLGIGVDEPHATRRVRLEPGESLVLYTDGVTEARDPHGAQFGAGALARVLAAHRAEPPGRLARACLDAVTRFRAGGEPSDDVTIMVIRRLAAA
jgi:sigma-B regulation protein RsbU (phosphoserine phosphatase)